MPGTCKWGPTSGLKQSNPGWPRVCRAASGPSTETVSWTPASPGLPLPLLGSPAPPPLPAPHPARSLPTHLPLSSAPSWLLWWRGSGCKLCPMDWRLWGDKCYWVSPDSKLWSESRSDCAERGSQLLVIRDRAELVKGTRTSRWSCPGRGGPWEQNPRASFRHILGREGWLDRQLSMGITRQTCQPVALGLK
uniref:C-type lectin domain-containing protein n=1 Tax=Pelusios castaneus TaxID=367368 RepID=A0A8C8RKB5_9SAUR